jgi:hypothetical protein
MTNNVIDFPVSVTVSPELFDNSHIKKRLETIRSSQRQAWQNIIEIGKTMLMRKNAVSANGNRLYPHNGEWSNHLQQTAEECSTTVQRLQQCIRVVKELGDNVDALLDANHVDLADIVLLLSRKTALPDTAKELAINGIKRNGSFSISDVQHVTSAIQEVTQLEARNSIICLIRTHPFYNPALVSLLAYAYTNCAEVYSEIEQSGHMWFDDGTVDGKQIALRHLSATELSIRLGIEKQEAFYRKMQHIEEKSRYAKFAVLTGDSASLLTQMSAILNKEIGEDEEIRVIVQRKKVEEVFA